MADASSGSVALGQVGRVAGDAADVGGGAAVKRLELIDMDLRKIRRIRYDHEPTPSPEGFDELVIRGDRGTSGNIIHAYLQLIGAGGKLREPSRMGTVTIDDVALEDGHLRIFVAPGAQRGSFTLTNAVSYDAEWAGLATGERLISVGTPRGQWGFDHVNISGIRDSVKQRASDRGAFVFVSEASAEVSVTNLNNNPWNLPDPTSQTPV